jgi:hypothetical protein
MSAGTTASRCAWSKDSVACPGLPWDGLSPGLLHTHSHRQLSSLVVGFGLRLIFFLPYIFVFLRGALRNGHFDGFLSCSLCHLTFRRMSVKASFVALPPAPTPLFCPEFLLDLTMSHPYAPPYYAFTSFWIRFVRVLASIPYNNL